MKFDIIGSIVTYKSSPNELRRAINSFVNTDLKIKLYVIDNSPSDDLKNLCNHYEKVEYIFTKSNIGFGSAHNLAMNKELNNAKYHLVLNPDVFFDSGVLEELYEFMEKNKSVGLTIPKILYPNGDTQYSCKLLPTPLDLLIRRFAPFKKYVKKRNDKYELRFTGYDKIFEAPCLSGCFMFVRYKSLREVGLFDNRYFMYLEDFDLSRRVHKEYDTIFYPKVEIYHEYEKGSYKRTNLLWYHIKSAIKYFNKWGWFFDRERKRVNDNILNKLGYYNIKY